MNKIPREKLCQLIEKQGQSICDEPLRCKAFLLDQCGDYRLEVNLLMMALEEGIVTELRNITPLELILAQLGQKLEKNLAIKEDAAQWSVKSWAIALGLISESQLNQNQINHNQKGLSSQPISLNFEQIKEKVINKTQKTKLYSGTSKKILGIDLGTSKTVVAVNEGGQITIIPNTQGSNVTPSVVAYTNKGDFLIGIQAKNQAVKNVNNTFTSLVRFIGKKYNEIKHQIAEIPYQILPDDNDDINVYVPAINAIVIPIKIKTVEK